MRIILSVLLGFYFVVFTVVGIIVEGCRRGLSASRRAFRILSVPCIVAVAPFMFLGFVAEEIALGLQRAEDNFVAYMKELADD